MNLRVIYLWATWLTFRPQPSKLFPRNISFFFPNKCSSEKISYIFSIKIFSYILWNGTFLYFGKRNILALRVKNFRRELRSSKSRKTHYETEISSLKFKMLKKPYACLKITKLSRSKEFYKFYTKTSLLESLFKGLLKKTPYRSIKGVLLWTLWIFNCIFYVEHPQKRACIGRAIRCLFIEK